MDGREWGAIGHGAQLGVRAKRLPLLGARYLRLFSSIGWHKKSFPQSEE